MLIEKDEKVYTVKESDKNWTVSVSLGRVDVSYVVSKKICGSADALREYITKGKLGV